MIINHIMQTIWKPIKDEYQLYYEQAAKLSDQQLFELLLEAKMVYYQYPKAGMNLLSTCGCEHFYNQGSFAGCSMCNYHCNNIKGTAYLKALRDKNSNLYAKIVKNSFINKRGIIEQLTGEETITGFDVFSDMEFPPEVFEQMFLQEPIFKARPFIISVEARADHITEEKLVRMLKLFGKGRVVIEIGVEVRDEWVRNHWLNKNILDSQIQNAIELCHKYKIKLKSDVIFGIPGFTEKNSIDSFVQTVEWLHQIGSDYITVMPLNRKAYTLHNFIYEKMRGNERLQSIGIVQGEHTGLPWLFSFINGLSKCFDIDEGIPKKIGIGQYDTSLNSVGNVLCYNQDKNCDCTNKVQDAIKEFNNSKDPRIINDLFEQMIYDPCYPVYRELLVKQEVVKDVWENCQIIGEEMIKMLYPNNSNEIIDDWVLEIRKSDILNLTCCAS